MQGPSTPIVNASQDQGQDQPSTSPVEASSQDDQGQHSGQDGDLNDQVIIPRSNEEIGRASCRERV